MMPFTPNQRRGPVAGWALDTKFVYPGLGANSCFACLLESWYISVPADAGHPPILHARGSAFGQIRVERSTCRPDLRHNTPHDNEPRSMTPWTGTRARRMLHKSYIHVHTASHLMNSELTQHVSTKEYILTCRGRVIALI